jgi:phage-related protein
MITLELSYDRTICQVCDCIVYFYCNSNGNSPVLDWLKEQDQKVIAKFLKIFELLKENGISVSKPYVAPLEDKLYEIRVEQNTNIYRIVYFAYTGRRFILLNGFQKKTQKTPKKEIKLAKERLNDFLLDETSE